MIEKLLQTQGLQLKLNDFIKESAMKLSMPFLDGDTDDEKISFIEENMDENMAIQAFANIYSKYFSVTEIMDIIAFYKSPTGQKLAASQDKIAMEMVNVAQGIVERILLRAFKHNLRESLDKLDKLDLGELEDPDKFEELT